MLDDRRRPVRIGGARLLMVARLRILRLRAARIPLLLARAARLRAVLLRAALGGIPAATAPAPVVSSSAIPAVRTCALGTAPVVATGLLLHGRHALAFFQHPGARFADLLVAMGLERVVGWRPFAVVARLRAALLEILRAPLLSAGLSLSALLSIGALRLAAMPALRRLVASTLLVASLPAAAVAAPLRLPGSTSLLRPAIALLRLRPALLGGVAHELRAARLESGDDALLDLAVHQALDCRE